MKGATLPILTINKRQGDSGPPAILDDGNTLGWYHHLENITKDGADAVSVWGDKTANGNDLAMPTGYRQPLYESDGILFDGITNAINAAFTFADPEMIYIAFKSVTWTSCDCIFVGYAAAQGFIAQLDSTPGLKAYARYYSAENANLAVNTFGIAAVKFNGASSRFIINNTTALTWSVDDTYDMDGICIGARGNFALPSNIKVKEIIVRAINESVSDETNIIKYLKSNNSISY